MQINSITHTQVSEKSLQDAYMQETNTQNGKSKHTQELTVEEQINKSAIEVTLSMNAQIILFAMDAQQLSKDNAKAQTNILNFLSGKKVEGELSLKDIGYEGKPITELSSQEASELVSEEGFFGVNKTSQRVADFVFGFAGDDLSILEKGREGIVQGFEDAKKMWGGELPEISYKTQAKTLELIDAKIAELKGTDSNQEIEEN